MKKEIRVNGIKWSVDEADSMLLDVDLSTIKPGENILKSVNDFVEFMLPLFTLNENEKITFKEIEEVTEEDSYYFLANQTQFLFFSSESAFIKHMNLHIDDKRESDLFNGPMSFMNSFIYFRDYVPEYQILAKINFKTKIVETTLKHEGSLDSFFFHIPFESRKEEIENEFCSDDNLHYQDGKLEGKQSLPFVQKILKAYNTLNSLDMLENSECIVKFTEENGISHVTEKPLQLAKSGEIFRTFTGLKKRHAKKKRKRAVDIICFPKYRAIEVAYNDSKDFFYQGYLEKTKQIDEKKYQAKTVVQYGYELDVNIFNACYIIQKELIHDFNIDLFCFLTEPARRNSFLFNMSKVEDLDTSKLKSIIIEALKFEPDGLDDFLDMLEEFVKDEHEELNIYCKPTVPKNN